MRTQIGVWSKTLQAERPRGIQRVAREIALRLHDTPEMEYFAVTRFVFHSGVVSAEVYPLDLYLSCVPYQTPDPERALREAGVQPRFEPATRLDIMLSFECYDEIWDWPLRELGIEGVCVVHDLIPFRIEELSSGDNKNHFYKHISNMLGKAAATICVSKSTANDLIRVFPNVSPAPVVVYNGSGGKLLDRASERNAERKRFELSNPITIAMVGTVEIRKNHQGVMRALPIVAERLKRLGHSLRFVVVGDTTAHGDLFGNEFKHLLSQAQQCADIHFTNFVDDASLARWYLEMDLIVFASLWEGFGIPILEAMSFGVPVAASVTSSHPEVGGDCVRYFDPYDIDDIADKICESLELTTTDRMIEVTKARKWVRNFGWDAAAADYVQIFRKLAAGEALPERLPLLEAIETFDPSAISGGARPDLERAAFLTLDEFMSWVDAGSQKDIFTAALLAQAQSGAPDGALHLLIGLPEKVKETATAIAARADGFSRRHPGATLDFVTRRPAARSSIEELRTLNLLHFLVHGDEKRFGLTVADLANGVSPYFTVRELLVRGAGSAEALKDGAVAYGSLLRADATAGRIVDAEAGRRALNEAARQIWRSGDLDTAIAQSKALPPKRVNDERWLDQGLDILVLLETTEDAKEVRDAMARLRLSWPRLYNRILIVVTDASASRADEPGLLVACDDDSAQFLCALARVVVCRAESPGALNKYALLAALDGKSVIGIGPAATTAPDTLGVVSAPTIEDALAFALSDAAETSPGAPYYFPGCGRLLRLLRNLSLGVRNERLHADAIRVRLDSPLTAAWLDIVEREILFRPVRDELKAAVRASVAMMARATLPCWLPTKRIDSADGQTYVLSRPAVGSDIAGVQNCAELLNACLASYEWVDYAEAWRTHSLEQLNRLFEERRFSYVIFCGENWNACRFTGADAFARDFLDELFTSGDSVVFAGGENFGPLPSSRVFVTGPIVYAGPVFTASNFALVPPIVDMKDRPAVLQAMLRSLLEGSPCFCEVEAQSWFRDSFRELPHDWLLVYQQYGDIVAQTAAIEASPALEREVFARTEFARARLFAALGEAPPPRILFTDERRQVGRLVHSFVEEAPEDLLTFEIVKLRNLAGAERTAIAAEEAIAALLDGQDSLSMRTRHPMFSGLAGMAPEQKDVLRAILLEFTSAGSTGLAPVECEPDAAIAESA